MAVLPIRISGDPVLHTPASPVVTIDDELRALVADMFETMDAAPGVGLAGPQVGVPLRLFVFSYTEDTGEEEGDDTGSLREYRGVAINPELYISPTSVEPADPDTESEGCLSFPGERFPLVRGESAILRATDLDGRPYEIEAHGWLARIFQHEFDHLDGLLYVDRVDPVYAKVARKIERKKGWGVPGNAWLPGVDELDA
ncbi:peptide deformylase [Herbiconiux sp. CPCC 205716]|uniref:Peptide deformylase n=1 Tax=Herbiconiux gentiana TaxID=2970912 RepID=A0ABT2GFH3_9MICO|nr:peptide deformylase [Herbiconiux gentiana]MCS5714978.1 peptide deformylase [Herbiconiux gentiana]